MLLVHIHILGIYVCNVAAYGFCPILASASLTLSQSQTFQGTLRSTEQCTSSKSVKQMGLSAVDQGFPIGGHRRCEVFTLFVWTHSVGALTSDAGAFQWKRLQKQKNWVLLGVCISAGPPGSATDRTIQFTATWCLPWLQSPHPHEQSDF